MKIYNFFLICLLFSGSVNTEKVFICKGGNAYAYHKTIKCSWLQNCTHKIIEVTLDDAKAEYKRKPCKPCYK